MNATLPFTDTRSRSADLATLVDKRRDLSAQLAGINSEICMAVGDRDGARRYMQEMNAQTIARKAAQASALEASHG